MRVVEAFGPTVQGEGPLAGRVTHFLRLGGCDYRCSWCDTPYAVDPAQVRQAENLSDEQVLDRLDALAPAPLLTLSGGNPVLWPLSERFLDGLRWRYDRLAVETQGSRWREWVGRVDSLVVSPKPPSSGMATAEHRHQFDRFMSRAFLHPGLALKVVVFDGADLDWARTVHASHPRVPFYLSAGTDIAEAAHADVVAGVAARYGWLCEQVAAEPDLSDAVVLPQLHVIAWGQRVGV
jgi:7-carboxy-7-deazaguanine synthase